MPLARHDLNTDEVNANNDVSTHMPLARHDADAGTVVQCDFKFLLTCLLRGMTLASAKSDIAKTFLLTCLLRGMTRFCYD